MPLPCEASPVSCFIAEKSEVKSVALICGTAADVLAAAEVVVLEEDVVDELHPETATTSPTESNAPVSATDLRAVSIVFPFVVNSPMALFRIVTPSRSSATAQGCRYRIVMSKEGDSRKLGHVRKSETTHRSITTTAGIERSHSRGGVSMW